MVLKGTLGGRIPAEEDQNSEAVKALGEAFFRVGKIVQGKEKTYRGAWKRQGYMGNLARILSKVARLEAMLWRDRERSEGQLRESVEDTVLDLMALCAFFLENWSAGNRWGRGSDRESDSQHSAS